MRGVLAVVSAVLVLLGCSASAGLAVADYPKTAFGPEGMRVQRGTPLASPAGRSGRPVAGVSCGRPGIAFHIHVHLSVYVSGLLRPIPATIGMVAPYEKPTESGPFYNAHTCYYELHTHAQDGVIHAEAPSPRTFTLGQFFALWGQRLTRHRVGSELGPTRVYVDGRLTAVPPSTIPLRNRSVIQIDVGAVVPPQPVDWSHF